MMQASDDAIICSAANESYSTAFGGIKYAMGQILFRYGLFASSFQKSNRRT